MDFLNEQKVLEIFQSGFKRLHSTESALLRVFNDIFLATDAGQCVILVLLDLTAAFDTVDHDILVARKRHLASDLSCTVKLNTTPFEEHIHDWLDVDLILAPKPSIKNKVTGMQRDFEKNARGLVRRASRT